MTKTLNKQDDFVVRIVNDGKWIIRIFHSSLTGRCLYSSCYDTEEEAVANSIKAVKKLKDRYGGIIERRTNN
jgi:hypothetical protein